MWKPGIKLGPEPCWKNRLKKSGAKYCEVWYNAGQKKQYAQLFSYLRDHSIHTGLHFWGILEQNILANIAYPDKTVWEPTQTLIKQTIDTAAHLTFEYVNIHVGNAALSKVFFTPYHSELVPNSVVSYSKATALSIQRLQELKEYADKKHTLLVVETIPPCDPKAFMNLEDRNQPHSTYALASDVVEKAAQSTGIAVNNDISHTAAECPSRKKAVLWQYLLSRTKALAPYTRIIHSNTLMPPFNGTDSHDGILNADFNRGVFPNKKEFITLLKLFCHRNDVWIINEPRNNHVRNFRALEKIQQLLYPFS